MPDTTPIIVATISLIGSALLALVTWMIARGKKPIEESTATAANAAALSKASTEMVAAFRDDVADLRTRLEGQDERLERQGERIDTLETRDRAWSRFYADLHQRWAHHRQQATAPTIDT